MCQTSSFGPSILSFLFFGVFFFFFLRRRITKCWHLLPLSYKQKGGVQRGGEGERRIEEGRVAAFRTTDTQRGFILSPKIQPSASSPGAEADVCARLPSPLVTRQPRPPGFEDVPGACTLDLGVFVLSERRGCASCENLPLVKTATTQRRSCSRFQRAVMLRTYQSSAPGPDC